VKPQHLYQPVISASNSGMRKTIISNACKKSSRQHIRAEWVKLGCHAFADLDEAMLVMML
jgi:hypothetical protein